MSDFMPHQSDIPQRVIAEPIEAAPMSIADQPLLNPSGCQTGDRM
jgi:hypothetical protein